ncbi:MAG: GTP pyrophosphokinase family protein [Erysipelotrichaceae bacterium]|nr:GTP pyrophosphokinase family protein [Erysipelotrichaceae bacterium]MDY5251493.1 GTP pyrophosphokinase family protein [Erysipelotrichaceae bacterium]
MDANNSQELQKYLLEHQDNLVTHIIQFNQLMRKYEAAIKEITTKLEILKSDFLTNNNRKSIETIQSRIKKPYSILHKLNKKHVDINLETIQTQLNDVAGIRVICPFIDDIYLVAEKLAKQDDITVIQVKDYINAPKENGYRSYHMIVEVPVFFLNKKEPMRVEIQLRTVAMDFWASLEHEIKYKKKIKDEEYLQNELKQCADSIAQADQKMLELRKYVHGS